MNRPLACSLIALPLLLGPLALARDAGEQTDVTEASVAALKASLGQKSVDVDEVRVTHDGIACIDYRVHDAQGGKTAAHAVVQGTEVVHSTTGKERFEKMWGDHCLGPHGGMTSSP